MHGGEMKTTSISINRWEPILMAGLGAAVAQLDPSLDMRTMTILVIKAFIGAAVGAYFGNHLSTRRQNQKNSQPEPNP